MRLFAFFAVALLSKKTDAFVSRQSISFARSPAQLQPCRSLQAIPEVLSAVDTFWKTSPYIAAALTCGFKASAADVIAQKRQIKKQVNELVHKGVDFRRNFAYILYGSVYQGISQEFIYNHLYPVWFGAGTSPAVVITKVLFDVTVQTILVTLPIAYLAKASIYKHSVMEAFRRYKDDIMNHGLLKKYIALWVPVNLLTFSIIPVHYRVSWIAFVSFFWLIILSSIASRQRPTTTIEETVAMEAMEEDLLTNTEEDVRVLVGKGVKISV